MKKFILSSFILFLSFFGIKNVNAETNSIELDVNTLQLAGLTYSSPGTFKAQGTTYIGVSTTNSSDINGYYSIFNLNTVFDSSVDKIGFFYYNNALYYGNSSSINNTYDSIDVIPPLVRLNNHSCSVKPIGTTSNTINSSYNYSDYYWVECDIIDDATSYSINVRYIPKSNLTSLQVGIQQKIVTWANTDTEKAIQDAVEKNAQATEEVKDAITSNDTTESQNQANSFFEGFESDDYGLSDIITMPLELIRGLTSNSCVALNLTIPFVNKSFDLPCMSSIYQEYFGNFFTLYQTITFGFVAYWVVVKIFALVKGFKDPDDDKVEVMDL